MQILKTDEELDADDALFVNHFVLIAEYMDNEGTTKLYWQTADKQTAHSTLGLLEFARTIEKARVIEGNSPSD